jgi:hypothetical protein
MLLVVCSSLSGWDTMAARPGQQLLVVCSLMHLCEDRFSSSSHVATGVCHVCIVHGSISQQQQDQPVRAGFMQLQPWTAGFLACRSCAFPNISIQQVQTVFDIRGSIVILVFLCFLRLKILRCRCTPCSAAEGVLSQLSNDAAWQQLEPHFGSKFAAQLLDKAASVSPAVPDVKLPSSVQLPSVQLSDIRLPSAPQLPNVQLPNMPNVQLPNMSDVKFPEVHMPSVQLRAVPQLPAVQLPDGQALLQGLQETASSATTAAEGLTHLPADLQQRLGLLEAQLQQLAAGNGTYEPHFGTRAVMSWLQEVVAALSSAVHASPMLQPLSASAAGLPASMSSSHQLLLHGSGGSSFGSSSSSILGGFGGVGDPTAALQAMSAALKAVAASAAASMPAELSNTLSASAGALAEQSAAASAALQQLQGSLAQAESALQQLPEQGLGGYDFPTLCLVAAGAIAAIAASVPAADASAAFGDEGTPQDDVLTHDYDAQAVARYFKRRPVVVAQRAAQLAAEMSGFGLPLLGDLWTGRLQVRTCNLTMHSWIVLSAQDCIVTVEVQKPVLVSCYAFFQLVRHHQVLSEYHHAAYAP